MKIKKEIQIVEWFEYWKKSKNFDMYTATSQVLRCL